MTLRPGLQYLLINIGMCVGWFCMFEVWNKWFDDKMEDSTLSYDTLHEKRHDNNLFEYELRLENDIEMTL